MAHMLLTVQLSADEANLAAAARRLAVSPAALDADFGVIAVDRGAGLYAVMVEESVVADATARPGVEGPYANPPIQHFGPPEPPADGDVDPAGPPNAR